MLQLLSKVQGRMLLQTNIVVLPPQGSDVMAILSVSMSTWKVEVLHRTSFVKPWTLVIKIKSSLALSLLRCVFTDVSSPPSSDGNGTVCSAGFDVIGGGDYVAGGGVVVLVVVLMSLVVVLMLLVVVLMSLVVVLMSLMVVLMYLVVIMWVVVMGTQCFSMPRSVLFHCT